MALQGKRPSISIRFHCFSKAVVLQSDVNNYGGIRSTMRREDGRYR
jgi:hypothetical protein